MNSFAFEVNLPECFLKPLILNSQNNYQFELKPLLPNDTTSDDNLSGMMTITPVSDSSTSQIPTSPNQRNIISALTREISRKRSNISTLKQNTILQKRPNLPVNNLKLPPSVQNKSNPSAFQSSAQFAECFLDGDKFFMCTSCAYKSNRKDNITRHLAVKHSNNPPVFKCSSCGSSFTEKNKLKSHYMKAHKFQENVAKAAADAS